MGSTSPLTLKSLQSEARRLGISPYGTKKQLYNRIYYTNKVRRKMGGRTTRVKKRSRIRSRRKRSQRTKRKSRANRRSRSKKRNKTRSRKRSYFKKGNKLSEPHRKYCRCIYHVADKQSSKCLKQRAWETKVDGKQCYNPYAICSKSTKRKGSVECFKNTNLNALPQNEIKALADLKRMSVAELRAKHRDT